MITGGIDGIALTKLDMLEAFEEIKLCTGYRLDGTKSTICRRMPTSRRAANRFTRSMEGWNRSTRGARSWAELPAQAVKYVRRVEELIGAPVALLSTSPEREDTILVRDPFIDR